jgi:hypothetical protein
MDYNNYRFDKWLPNLKIHASFKKDVSNHHRKHSRTEKRLV